MTIQESLDNLADGCITENDVAAKLVAPGCTKAMTRKQRYRTCPVAQWLEKTTGKLCDISCVCAHDTVGTWVNSRHNRESVPMPAPISKFIRAFDIRSAVPTHAPDLNFPFI